MTIEATTRHCIKCYRVVTSTDVELLDDAQYGKRYAVYMDCPHCGRRWVEYMWETPGSYDAYPNGEPNK